MIVTFYFLISACLYSLSASLPFLVTKSTQMWIAPVVAILTSLVWVSIARSIPPQEVPLYGLYYDIMLTLVFLVIPYIFVDFNLTPLQIFGILLIFTGIILTR
jgi:membrane protease YdiL (CAAX protease family)